MKEQLYMDFKIDGCETREEFIATLEKYVDFYNNHRPCYAIGYDTPVNYRKRFYKGEMERKNTFESRILTEEPKFVQKRHLNKAFLMSCLLLKMINVKNYFSCLLLLTSTTLILPF